MVATMNKEIDNVKRPKTDGSGSDGHSSKTKCFHPIWLAVIAALMIFAASAASRYLRKDVLVGIWYCDEVTAYQFDGKGDGKLILPDKEYPFSYEIKDETLSINFESSDARDSIYTFSVEGNQLTLTRTESNGGQTYTLTK